MQGAGIYIYADGVRYDGQYKDDKKEGYGQYFWTDGRKYEGWWHLGKQHGLGTYTDAGKQPKFGLWENGKRVKWLDNTEVEKVARNKLDLGSLFTEANSERVLRQGATFSKPGEFDWDLARVRQVLNLKFK